MKVSHKAKASEKEKKSKQHTFKEEKIAEERSRKLIAAKKFLRYS